MRTAFLLLIILGLIQCKTQKLNKSLQGKYNSDEFYNLIYSDSILNSHFVGLHIIEPNGDNVFSLNEDKYFTPASNMKLYTYYLARKILDNQIKTFRYTIENDTLIVQGLGDPSFLNSQYETIHPAWTWIKNQNHPIKINFQNFRDLSQGSGWAWDDFQYYYQVEKSSMPLYGNVASFEMDSISFSYSVIPEYFSDKIKYGAFEGGISIMREKDRNLFLIDTLRIIKTTIQKPIRLAEETIISLLGDTLRRKVHISHSEYPEEDWNYIEGIHMDSIYESLLRHSDNFVAEQILLMCSQSKLDYMNSDSIISHALENEFGGLPDKIRWEDGSGLSRYNLVTPRSTTWLFKDLYKEDKLEHISKFLPVGDEEDTLDPLFSSDGIFIHAKTGTLSNNFNLSGYLITDKQNLYIFSFMNNHYIHPKSKVLTPMYKLLKHVKENW